jgi:hypothetical protein
MRTHLLATLALAAPTLAAPVAGACTRDVLKAATAAYLAAQTSGAGTFAALGASTTYTENFKAGDVGKGILAQPLKIDFSRSLYDTTQCATYTEVVVTDAAHPYVLGTQLWFAADGSAVERMETLVSDQGDWLFNAAGTLKWAAQEAWTDIPEADRDSRAVIQAAGDAYCDIFSDKSVKVPWGTPCARLEGGSYTGRGAATDSCNVGIPDGVKLTNRRYVIDEVVGAVDIFMTFGSNLPDSHEFRVEKGKLRFVHTITIMGGSGRP